MNSKEEIIADILDGMRFSKIAIKYGMTTEELNEFMTKYCEENNCRIVATYGKREIIKKSEKDSKFEYRKRNYNKLLENAIEIKKWCDENKRFPQKTEKNSIEQKHLYQYKYLQIHTWEYRYMMKPEEIEDDRVKKIVQIMDYLDENYNTSKIYLSYKQIKELEQWCYENGRRPQKLSGVQIAEKGNINTENETKEQKELRMYYILENAIQEFACKDQSQLKWSAKRGSYRIVQDICKKFRGANEENKEFTNEEIEARVSFLQKKGATNEQIEAIMKKYYGIKISIQNNDNSKKRKKDDEFEL